MQVAQIFRDYLGFLEIHFKVITAVATFWVKFWINLAYF